MMFENKTKIVFLFVFIFLFNMKRFVCDFLEGTLNLKSGNTYYLLLSNNSSEKKIVIIHGLCANFEQHLVWGHILRSEGYQVLLYDLLGHGKSDWKLPGYYTPDRYVAQLNELLTAIGWVNNTNSNYLANINSSNSTNTNSTNTNSINTNNSKLSLLGVSMGGLIALKYAIKYPEQVDKLIMMSPPGLITHDDIPQLYKLSNSRLSDILVNTYKHPKLFRCGFRCLRKLDIIKLDDHDPELSKDKVYEHRLKEFSAIVKSAGNTNLFDLHSEFYKLSQLTYRIKMIFFWGLNDTTVPLSPAIPFLSEHFPKTPIVVFPIIGHIPLYPLNIPIKITIKFLNDESNIGTLLGQIKSIDYFYDNSVNIVEGIDFTYSNTSVFININGTKYQASFFENEFMLDFPDFRKIVNIYY